MSGSKKTSSQGVRPKTNATAARYQRLKREILKLPGAREAYEEGRRMAALQNRTVEQPTIVGQSRSEQLDSSDINKPAERKPPSVYERSKRRETSDSAIKAAQHVVRKHKRKDDKSVADELLQDRRKEVKRER